jgi:hypothetical protein
LLSAGCNGTGQRRLQVKIYGDDVELWVLDENLHYAPKWYKGGAVSTENRDKDVCTYVNLPVGLCECGGAGDVYVTYTQGQVQRIIEYAENGFWQD